MLFTSCTGIMKRQSSILVPHLNVCPCCKQNLGTLPFVKV
jgi:hypothetical protein